MVGEIITGAVTGASFFNSLLNITKGMKDMNDAAVRNAAVIELQKGILSAQEQQAALVERIRELEEKVRSFETWDAEKERYELKEIAPGVHAYTMKEAVRGTEPEHKICANCFGNRKKSYLQGEMWMPGRADVLVCHGCGSVLYITGHPYPEHKTLRPSQRR